MWRIERSLAFKIYRRFAASSILSTMQAPSMNAPVTPCVFGKVFCGLDWFLLALDLKILKLDNDKYCWGCGEQRRIDRGTSRRNEVFQMEFTQALQCPQFCSLLLEVSWRTSLHFRRPRLGKHWKARQSFLVCLVEENHVIYIYIHYFVLLDDPIKQSHTSTRLSLISD